MAATSQPPYQTFPIRLPAAGIAVAALLWFVMFSPWTAPGVNFWLAMSCSAALLSGYSLYLRRRELPAALGVTGRDILIGLLCAAGLYGFFFLGNELARMLFSFAGSQIGGVYATRSQASPALIGALLLLLIGPAEEIFWRGLAQEQFMQKFGEVKGFILTTTAYTLVHLPSWNFMLLAAALVAGLFWGFLYMKVRRLAPCIISHALWDCVIFAIFPIS